MSVINFDVRKLILIIIIIIIIFVFNDLFAQNWENIFHFNSTNNSQVTKALFLESKNEFYVCGLFNGNLAGYSTRGQSDFFVTKIKNNNLVWFKQIGSSNADIMPVMSNNEDTIYFLGSAQGVVYIGETDTLNCSSGYRDMIFLKFDSNGRLLRKKRLAYGNGHIATTSIDYDNINNCIILTGFYNNGVTIGSYSFTGANNFIAKIDLNGNVLWVKNIIGNNTQSRFWDSKAFDDGYYFTGWFYNRMDFDIKSITSNPTNRADFFIYKTDFNGNGIWIRRSYGSESDLVTSIVSDNYGSVYVTGYYRSSELTMDSTNTQVSKAKLYGKGVEDIFLIKLNKTGNLIWMKNYSSPYSENALDIKEKNDILYITGYYTTQLVIGDDTLKSKFSNDTNIFIATFDLNGNTIKSSYIEGYDSRLDRTQSIFIDSQNKVYLGGFFKSSKLFVGKDTLINNDSPATDGILLQYTPTFKAVFTEVKNPSCFGMTDGYLKVTPYYGDPPYTYKWSHNNNLNNNIASNLSAGKYTVTVTDKYGKQSVASVTLTQPSLLSVSAIISNVKCYNGNDGSININVNGGTPGYIYRWTAIEGSGVITDAEDQTTLTKGKYALITTDKNLCTRNDTFVINQPQKIIFKGSNVTPIINPPGNNGAVDLNVSGGTPIYVYSWSGPENFSSNSQDISNLSVAGIYTVHVTDNNNCKTDTSFVVGHNLKLLVYISAKKDVDCKGNSTGGARVSVINGSGNYTYKWRDNLGYPIGGNIDTLINVPGGTYFIKVVDNTKNDSAETYVVINEPSTLSLTLISQNLRCANDNSGFIDLRVTGGTLPYSFLWSNGKTTEDLINISAGDYYVTVTDANNCIASSNKEITQPDPIVVSFKIDKPIFCYGDNDGVITCNASGGYGQLSYFWSDPGNQTTPTATALAAGTYTCTVTDENNCKREGTVQLNQPLEIRVLSTIYNPSCYGYTDGKIINDVAGGTPPYYFNWSNGQTVKDLENIGAGDYAFTVTDYYNCKKVKNYSITEPDPIIISNVEKTEPICYGYNGNIKIYVTGGNGSYTYSIDGGNNYQSNASFTTKAGSYEAIVKDLKGCLSEKIDVILSQPEKIKIEVINVTNPTCYGHNDGIIEISASGGVGSYQYSIDGGNTYSLNNIFNEITNNSYNIVVKDENNCISDDSVVVVDKPEKLVIKDLIKRDITCYGNNDGYLKIMASGGNGNIYYSLDGGLTFSQENEYNSLQKGSYTALLKDENNCFSRDSVVDINEPQAIVIDSILKSEPTCFGYSDGRIIINASGGTGVLQYSIDGGQTYLNNNIFYVSAGEFTIKVKDENNCQQFNNLVITQPSQILIDTISKKNQDDYSFGEIEFSVQGGSSPLNFILKYENRNDSLISRINKFTKLQAGNYIAYVIDTNSCKSNYIEFKIDYVGARDIIIYDAFSPNGDGVNDVWNIGNIEYYPDCNVIIYNSWGVKVFSSKGYKIPWDGTYNGKYLPSGTYYYVIDLSNGKKYTGTVNIVK